MKQISWIYTWKTWRSNSAFYPFKIGNMNNKYFLGWGGNNSAAPWKKHSPALRAFRQVSVITCTANSGCFFLCALYALEFIKFIRIKSVYLISEPLILSADIPPATWVTRPGSDYENRDSKLTVPVTAFSGWVPCIPTV